MRRPTKSDSNLFAIDFDAIETTLRDANESLIDREVFAERSDQGAREDPLPRLEPIDLAPHLFDSPRAFRSGGERPLGFEVMLSLDLQHIGKVERRALDADQHLARTRLGPFDLLDPEVRGPAPPCSPRP